MGKKTTVKVLVDGGKATAGPPLGPSLGPLGMNVLAVVNKINELTAEFSGMKVPVTITVDVETKEFEVTVGTPTTSALIIREIKAEKGSGNAGSEKVGNLTIQQIVKIAKIKRGDKPKSLKSVVKEIAGTCLSMGVTIEGKDPRTFQREVDEGLYDGSIKE